ncbi:MAG: saccharopine dehydrogenase NADP-binding domain-containing protein [Actinomycetota bacterium]
MTSRADRPYDLIVFGATSFVGEILCRHLVARHGVDGDVSWAIAGRSGSKLESVAASTGADVPRIVADAADTEAMGALADAARVVISTVGPYALYGSELVAAVAEAGTDYVDLTGEAQWMQAMIDAHSATAERTGARIVHTCGFDSIPSDLGVWFTQQQAQELFGTSCSTIAMRVKAMKGGASGGTIASIFNMMDEARNDNELRKTLANPYALAPVDMRTGVKQPNVVTPTRDEASGEWVAPFVMAGINTKVVHRTHALLGLPWGREFRYDEAMLMGSGPRGAAKAGALTGGLGGFMGLAAFGPARSLLGRFLPDPGEGPSPEAQEAGLFDVRFHGSTDDGQTITTRVTGDRDPGYGSTAKMLGESATTLLTTNRGAKTGTPGGFWTPATAMGDRLIAALEAEAGLTFDVL